ncbi:MAG: SDR family oxidoreductase [Betaproteobacteria bacterium]|nr:MAG: SDR family oxidoreductase [Betaproteobacteria bacterium]
MADPKMMEGKVVVVTGAGRGIGAAIAKMAAAHGAKVVVNDIGVALDGAGGDQTPAQEVVNDIKKAGGEAAASYDSVAEFSSAAKIIQCAMDNFGRIDGVVNNAGILRDVIFHKMSESDWDSVVNVMLKGAFNCARHAADHFRKQESGAFVHMTSTSGLIGGMGQANYGAAKLGMVALSKAIAVDMSRFNVRSNCIAPVAWTRMTASIPAKDPATAARIEQRKQVTPEHNAPLAVFLLSDAAKGVNAQVFATRKNEIFLMSQSRPLRGIHRADGWTPERCAEHMYPALKNAFYNPVERTADVFPWDSI